MQRSKKSVGESAPLLKSAVAGRNGRITGVVALRAFIRYLRPAIDEASMGSAPGERLAKFKMPKRVFIVDSLPRNTIGKVQKAALRENGIYAVPAAPRQSGWGVRGADYPYGALVPAEVEGRRCRRPVC
jgi:hypothetical protein